MKMRLTLLSVLLPLASFTLAAPYDDGTTTQMTISLPHKRIAIIGGGTAGVTTLKTLLTDIPLEKRGGWEVVLFEQRAGVGGVW